jgi:hypothetical protein
MRVYLGRDVIAEDDKKIDPELSTALILGATLLLRWLKKHTRLLNADGRRAHWPNTQPSVFSNISAGMPDWSVPQFDVRSVCRKPLAT